jgi:hypothetical protein
MTNQQKAVLILMIITFVFIVLFGMGLSVNRPNGMPDAEDFDHDEHPVFHGLSSLLGHFAPKLNKDELQEVRPSLSEPGVVTFKVLPAEKDNFRIAHFCLTDGNKVRVIYKASKVEERSEVERRFEFLEEQQRDLTVDGDNKCSNFIILKRPGEIKFIGSGSVRVLLRDDVLIPF